jgi:hypothetical protein
MRKPARKKATKKSMRPRKKAVAKSSTKKTAKNGAAWSRYNPQTGELTGREVKALKRFDKLIKASIDEGMGTASARLRGLALLRNNPRR